MTTSRKEKAAETEAALKAAAARLFVERGYLSTKITDITREAGRAAGSFYNHFASKEALLEALLKDLADAGDEAAEEPGHSADFTDPAAIRYHLRSLWTFYRDNAGAMLAVRQAAMVDEGFGTTMRQFGTVQQEELHDHLDTIIASSDMKLPGTPELSISMMTLLLDSFAHQWLFGPAIEGVRRPDDEEAIEALTRFIYRGLTGKDY
ncbi:TetR/AcrR family transcriptional regulator [Amycolatopsis minnesotensis]|uniref:TetR/AcrR family transcriptional regulator n=1 Tax=Amycolatopsis minnesotensis TaxID=337894 RepID=A0ABP5DZY6_9PSEU